MCLSFSPHDSVGLSVADWSHPTQDKHKAPASTQPLPLSLQDAQAPNPLVGPHNLSGKNLLAITLIMHENLLAGNIPLSKDIEYTTYKYKYFLLLLGLGEELSPNV